MKKITYILLMICIMPIVKADYLINIPLTKSGGGALSDDSINITSYWKDSSTEYSQWSNTGEIYGCSNWSPLTSSITIGENFTQTATDCSQNQVRTAQDKEVETISGITQNKGASYVETKTITVSNTRDAVGSLENWIATTSIYTSWVNSGDITECSNWSPETNTVDSGLTFVQTATDCKQTQIRTIQEREKETTTNQIRDIGTPISESKIITTSSTRNAVGSKVTTNCMYSNPRLPNGTSIMYIGVNYFYYVNGVEIAHSLENSLIHNGYYYTLGQLMQHEDMGWVQGYYYQLCKKAI